MCVVSNWQVGGDEDGSKEKKSFKVPLADLAIPPRYGDVLSTKYRIGMSLQRRTEGAGSKDVETSDSTKGAAFADEPDIIKSPAHHCALRAITKHPGHCLETGARERIRPLFPSCALLF